ncbi:type II toxin-antitoxin system VapC family toxin [Candidatus Poribacteria bacterium]|nr:type II toxin-antitoxin system VapC family toxin [Candidatus Poribacteria bacterium]
MNQNGRYLLDTNIAIALFSEEITVQVKVRNAAFVALAPPIIGELWYGAQKSDKASENLHRINNFVQQNAFFPCDLETAQWYGTIRDQLRRKGRPIPNNDIWIAAIAMQHDLILVTRDAHFDEVESLQTERW